VPLCTQCGEAYKGPPAGRVVLLILGLPASALFLFGGIMAVLIFTLRSTLGPGNVLVNLNGEQIVAIPMAFGFLAAVIALAAGLWLAFRRPTAPAGLHGVDLMTGVARIVFRNPAYVHLLQAHLAQQPMRAAPQRAPV